MRVSHRKLFPSLARDFLYPSEAKAKEGDGKSKQGGTAEFRVQNLEFIINALASFRLVKSEICKGFFMVRHAHHTS